MQVRLLSNIYTDVSEGIQGSIATSSGQSVFAPQDAPLLFDLSQPGQRVVVARGGRGGTLVVDS